MKAAHQTTLAAIAATSSMTLFSIIASKYEGQNFREPELLGTFISKTLKTDNNTSKQLGWATHYLIGIGWAAAYGMVLKSVKERSDLKNGLLFGTFGGIAAIFAWQKLFENHPAPPQINRNKFRLQLFVAHQIYGTVLAIAQKISSRKLGIKWGTDPLLR